jgi:O-antigen/teichoic acid export membrane protein
MHQRWIQSGLQHIRTRYIPEGSSLITTLVSGVAASIISLFISRILGAIAQVLIIQRLGVFHNGEYTTLTVLLSLFGSLLGFGLDIWLLQEAGREPANLSLIMRQVLILKTIAAIGLTCILGIFWSDRYTQATAFVVGAFGSIFESFAQTGFAAMRVRRENTRAAILQMITPLVLVVILFLIQRNDLSVLLLISIQTACSALLAGLVVSRIWKIQKELAPQALQLGRVLRKSWLFVVGEICASLYTQSGVLILSAYAGSYAVGLFSPARNIIFLTFLIPNLIFSIGLPLLMSPTIDRREYRAMLQIVLLFTFLYGIGMLIALSVFGDIAIQIFGDGYTEALPYLQAMAFIPLLKGFSFVWVAMLLSNLAQSVRVVIQAITVFISVVLGLVLIPAYGSVGAAWQALAIELFLFAAYGLAAWYYYRRQHA